MASDVAVDTPERVERPDVRERTAAATLVSRLAFQITNGRLTTGEFAALRRIDPSEPEPRHLAPMIRVLADIDVEPGPAAWRRLAIVANMVALSRGAHQSARPFGEGLHKIGFSEGRLVALLASDFDGLADLAPRIARRLGVVGYPCDLRQFADLIWYAGRDEEKADEARRRIAISYYRAQAKEKAA